MHVYSADNEKRTQVIIRCILISLILSVFISQLTDLFFDVIEIVNWHGALLESAVDVFFSFSAFGIIYGAYNSWLWKKRVDWHKIPDLNGKWEMEIRSSIKDRVVKGEVEIRQTWTHIGVYTKSQNDTAANSHMGEIIYDGLNTHFKYAFQVDRNGERYIGFNELRYDEEQKSLEGCYFTAKKFNKRQLKAMGISGLRDEDAKRLEDGIGSKGIVYMKKLS